MKRAISFIVTAAMLLSATAAAMPANAVGTATYEEYKELMKQTPEFPDPEERYYSYTDGDFEFHVYKEFAVVSDYKDTNATEITIPAEVPNTDTKKNVPVVGLVDTPFGSCHKLEKITIPDTLDHFTWPNLIVTTMVLIDSKEEVVPTVKEVAVSDTNPNFTVKDGLVYSKDMKTLVGCPPALGVKEVVLPEETETIGDYAFGDCYTLEKAVVPSTIKEMENDVFAGCINLKYAELPESMTFVPGQTFTFCTSLEEVKFNGVISEIGFESFYHCDSLKEFDIPDTVTAIGFGAFDETPCIENADGIRYLDNWVVKGDSKLCDVVIRDGTVGIAEGAFFGLSANYEPRVLDVPASVKYLGYNCYIGTTSAGPGTVHFRAASFPLKAVNGKNYTDIYFYDPEDPEQNQPGSCLRMNDKGKDHGNTKDDDRRAQVFRKEKGTECTDRAQGDYDARRLYAFHLVLRHRYDHIGQEQDDGQLGQFRRLEGDRSEIDPPFGAVDFSSDISGQHQHDHGQSVQFSRVFDVHVIIDLGSDQQHDK